MRVKLPVMEKANSLVIVAFEKTKGLIQTLKQSSNTSKQSIELTSDTIPIDSKEYITQVTTDNPSTVFGLELELENYAVADTKSEFFRQNFDISRFTNGTRLFGGRKTRKVKRTRNRKQYKRKSRR
jgi:hypothetical protein